MASFLILVVVSITVHWSNAVYADSSEELAKRFASEAQSQWDAYRLFSNRLQGSAVYQLREGATLVRHLRWEVKQNLTCRMFLVQSLLAKNESGNASIYNRSYAFSLTRRRDESLWVITDYVQRGEANEIPAIVRTTDKKFGITRDPIRLFSIDLSLLCAQPSFGIKSATQILRDGVELVEIRFDNRHALEHDKGSIFCPVQSGSMVLDPNHHWVMRACDVDCLYADGPAKITIEVNYRETPGDYLLPRRWVAKRAGTKTGGPIQTEQVDFEFSEPSSLPSDTEFILSSFGLPEPKFTSTSKSWYLWAALSGILCLVLAAFIRWKIRREDRTIE